ncbi:MAG: 16S rRNA (cytidine(1402)-2'-O)-methyltransferase [Erythrobacter sp.]|uniref:16S rRNA (cytidine(1402)-2'-O)-methyltransferase n=1 Tax=Erythrobacter sp. TaxID=1042 RepID=UPI0026326EDD|nr:16S rRNA (cytidine(1402)-2'-O)-methyltransferase [Erythrobacter sp.]MDJ0977703.1 16S rRNA (cytidine(1402)-2'-O)-methyltransferase [Erythrobacter sp.]
MTTPRESDLSALLEPGLYIVATPIGNLGDITLRAIDTLRRCAVIACEDTRVTGRLLAHLGIETRMQRYDDHASDAARARLLERAAQEPVALVSDAGTPLISDPGYRLVREARDSVVAVTSIPGACAAITGLTLSGLPNDRFLFAGFLPAKDKARRDALAELASVPATLVFYETGPRLVRSLEALAELWPDRDVAVARELTKLHEECRTGAAADLAAHYSERPAKGEIVLLVAPPWPAAPDEDPDALLREALGELPVSKAAARVSKATGLDRQTLYARAVAIKEELKRS